MTIRVLRRSMALQAFALVACLLPSTSVAQSSADKPTTDRPNFVVFFSDDLGYADLHCFGGPDGVTPNLDLLAQRGRRLTSFYVSQAVCSASRSALLTGCYNNRIGIQGALGPGVSTCLNPEEQTIAEVLQARGYKSAIFGKWHLGDHGIGLPTSHGFDEYFGLPYSNDMWPYHPTAKNYPPVTIDRWFSSSAAQLDGRRPKRIDAMDYHPCSRLYSAQSKLSILSVRAL